MLVLFDLAFLAAAMNARWFLLGRRRWLIFVPAVVMITLGGALTR